MIGFIPIEVECYAGYKGEESPRSLTWEGRRHEIEEIVDRWYQAGSDPRVPASDYYRVRTRGGVLFMIRMDRKSLAWYLMEKTPE
jgi:hypothetical protein